MISASEDFRRKLEGYGLTTAKIHFYYPDHPDIISPNFVLNQFYDVYPDFPELNQWLMRWPKKGPIALVRVEHVGLIGPTELRFAKGVYSLN